MFFTKKILSSTTMLLSMLVSTKRQLEKTKMLMALQPAVFLQ